MSILRARELRANEVTPFGPLHQEIMLTSELHGAIPLRVVHPLALLWILYTTCVPFAEFFDDRHAEHPSTEYSPWDFCLYTDEVVPGNAMAIDPSRKVQVLYASFLQFMPAALCREEFWFCITAKRSADVNKCDGAMAQVVGSVLKMLFCGALGTLSAGGIYLQRPGHAAIRLFARLGPIVQDGSAHKMMWHCKGDAGRVLIRHDNHKPFTRF
jgi:hypothetical protein